jgi:hypothetical protein
VLILFYSVIVFIFNSIDQNTLRRLRTELLPYLGGGRYSSNVSQLRPILVN